MSEFTAQGRSPLEKLWAQTRDHERLVDTVTTPMLRNLAGKKIDPLRLITHRFSFDRIMDPMRPSPMRQKPAR